MDPISLLILGAIGAAAAYAIVYFVNLTFEIIAKWFRNLSHLFQGINRNNLAFTIQSRMAAGQYKTVQGVFNNNSGSIFDARVIKSDQVDFQVQSAHDYGRTEVVIWQ